MCSVQSRLEKLRSQIRALEGHSLEPEKAPVLPLKSAGLNEPLPNGGLALGALHEIYAQGIEAELAASSTAFAACLAGQILRRKPDGYILWAAIRPDCYVPGLLSYGLDPGRIVWVDCRNATEVLGVMEEALHAGALAAVLGEACSLSLKAARRLDAAARRFGTPAILLKRQIFRAPKALAASGAAATRWRVSAAPSQLPSLQAKRNTEQRHPSWPPLRRPSRVKGEIHDVALDGRVKPGHDEYRGLGPPRWRLDLDYCRNGREASWIVEASDGAAKTGGKAGDVRVVAKFRDEAGAAEAAAARQTARSARSC